MPKLVKGSQEAKDRMKLIREKKTTISDINYETNSGIKTNKKSSNTIERDTEILKNGEKQISVKSIRSVNGIPISENQQEIIKQHKNLKPIKEEKINEDIITTNQNKKVGRPKKYNTKEEAKKIKTKQTIESNKRKNAERKQKKINGGKINLKKTFNKIGDKIEDVYNNTVQYGKAVIYGRNDYPPKVREILKNIGSQKIKSISIKRTPVSDLLTGALSFFSLGKFGKRLERSFDELFHLFIEITLENGQKVLLEKNEVINMDLNPSSKPDTETKQITSQIPNITFDEMLNNTEKYMGKQKYFSYSAKDNNCQDFILSFLKSNNIGDENDFSFVKQDTKQLFKNLPSLRKLSNTITTIGAKANTIIEGAGINEEKLIDEENNIYYNNITMRKKNNEIHFYFHIITDNDNESEDDEDNYIEGGKINFNNVKKGFEKVSGRQFKSPEELRNDFGITAVKKAGNQISNYTTSKKGGLASDLITYGIPAATGTVLGSLGNVVGGPALGVLGTAAGAKIGSEYIAPAVHKSSGAGMKKGRFIKGSQQAKDHMRKIRDMKRK